MEKEVQELLNAIKRDDVTLFASIVANRGRYLSLCYGRLPVLSLCYLYKSKKINKQFGKSLAKITNFLIVEEDYDSYKLFRAHAKTCLRLYVFEGAVVYPLEMLAILGDNLYLKQMYPIAYKNDKITDNIQIILATLFNYTSNIVNNKIIILGKNKLSSIQRISIIAVSVVFLLMIVFSSTVWGVLPLIKGKGTLANPIKINGEAQLLEAIEGDLHYVLTRDIVLTKIWSPVDFAGHINGKGNKIIASNFVQNGFIKELTGSVKDIEFVVDNLYLALDKSQSFFVDFNNGTISNIHMSVDAEFVQGEEVDTFVYISLLTLENYNEIKNCQIQATINFENESVYYAYFSTFAAINNGLITRCLTQQGSTINTSTVNVGGITAVNDAEGVVEECKNNAQISHISDKEGWFPQVGGIAIENYGIIQDCTNNGNIYAYSGASESDVHLYIGGIVSLNYNNILKSKNNANIKVNAAKFHIYLGGIASFNNTRDAVIYNCGSYGMLDASSEGENAYTFIGGIAGSNLGKIEDSFAHTEVFSDSANAFLGGIVGNAFRDYAIQINNYYVDYEKIKFGIAARMYDYFGRRVIEEATLTWGNLGVDKVDSYESLKEQEVYWNEAG